MIQRMIDYVCWLFLPSKFLYPPDTQKTKTLSIPGWETIDFISDQNQLKQINKETGKKYLGGSGNAFLTPMFGYESVFTLDGDLHKVARKVISSAMSKKQVKAKHLEFSLSIKETLDQLQLAKKTNVGIVSRQFTMKCMCSLVLGTRDPIVFEETFKSFEATTGYLANLVSYNRHFWEPSGKFSVGAISKKRVSKIDRIVYRLIDIEKSNPSSKNSILQTFLLQKHKFDYSDIFIRDNLVSIIAAGYDTTASAITWMLFWLSKEKGSHFRFFNLDGTINSQYVRSFIQESLRYCPPLEILPRRTLDQAVLACPCPHHVHHDAKVYQNPKQFKASRFLEWKPAPTEFLTFGAASRLCLGINLAPQLMEIFLNELLSRKVYLDFETEKFKPIRRNVSLWPSFRTRGKLTKISGCP